MVTSDGYILHLHRIGNDTPSQTNKTRIPVLLMHGLLETASSWIALGPKHSLGEKVRQKYKIYNSGFAFYVLFVFISRIKKCDFFSLLHRVFAL